MDNVQRIRLAAEQAAKDLPEAGDEDHVFLLPMCYEAPIFRAIAGLLESGKVSIVDMPEPTSGENVVLTTADNLLDFLDINVQDLAWKIWEVRKTPETWDKRANELLAVELGL
jgi:hypothetical protein